MISAHCRADAAEIRQNDGVVLKVWILPLFVCLCLRSFLVEARLELDEALVDFIHFIHLIVFAASHVTGIW